MWSRDRFKVGDAYAKAFKTDPTSAFGGIIAFNRAVDGDAARAISFAPFVEVVIAPEFSARSACDVRQQTQCSSARSPTGNAHNDFDFKRVGGGLLVQTSDDHSLQASDLKVVTVRKPSAQESTI